MTRSELTTPVVFIIFKRPDTTQRVFDVIRQARPKQLFVIADGPRNAEEAVRCDAARAIIDTVDWDCEVLTNYAEANMGLEHRISSGIDWVFEQVEDAIILEDDCLPDITFFRFCQELLDYYRDEPQIMHIGGNNFLQGRVSITANYYFSRYPHVWGWATWRRAWQHYDVDMKAWQDHTNQSNYLSAFENRHERNFWRYEWSRIITGKRSTWDFQWVFACLAQNGLAISPDRNLVSNIGAGLHASNTKRKRLTHAMLTESMSFPLRHMPTVTMNEEADAIAVSNAILNPPTGNQLLDSARSIAKHILWSIKR